MSKEICPKCNFSELSALPYDASWTCPSCGYVSPPNERNNPITDPKNRQKYIMEHYTQFWFYQEREREDDWDD
ncbi:hypothetical protein [Alicyclobacillus sp. SP_1]|jgi:transposase|uniref:hypothetical protein n=1 Tax=Alicyclobacillus sp. SP_1 TaxID=2942475 RepID=UPI0021576D8A|nr:hypothetical protein [Alicyclobacillus sp. SP_1]